MSMGADEAPHPPSDPQLERVRRRRLPNPAEQARREAWGKTWGAVGTQWKQAHNPKPGG